MVRRAALVLALGLVLPLAAPTSASAQETQGPTASDEEVAPFAVVDQPDDVNPYAPLTFESEGAVFPVLLPGVATARADDERQLDVTSGDVDGFRATSDGTTVDEVDAVVGVPLVGIDAPEVEPGGVIDTTSTTGSTSSTTGGSSAIPSLPDDDEGDGRQSFAFTDDTGTPIAPPAEDELPDTPDPSPPSEGIGAVPPTTTTTTPTPGPATTGSTSTSTPTTAPTPASSTTTTATPSTSTPTTSPAPTTTSTTRSTTTTTTGRSTTTTSSGATTTTAAPTTTTTRTAVPTTTTTQAPPTTTTTTPPQEDVFTFTQDRPNATSCVASSSSSQTCDAIWEIHLGATDQTLSFDLGLRNSGNVDASAIQLWAAGQCTNTNTAAPAGTGDLCGAIQLTIQRYSDAERTVPVECVYGGGTAQVCSLSSSRTLSHFSSTYSSSSANRAIGTGLGDGETFHLRVTLKLPNLDNSFQNRAATVNLAWRQVQ
jgi:hypothetical protein